MTGVSLYANHNTMKTPSLATPLGAQEMKLKTPKRRKKERSIHEKELAEIAVDSFWAYWGEDSLWSAYHPQSKDAWRAAVRSVLEEAIYRVEAKINGK